jgi:hypothetical protein
MIMFVNKKWMNVLVVNTNIVNKNIRNNNSKIVWKMVIK